MPATAQNSPAAIGAATHAATNRAKGSAAAMGPHRAPMSQASQGIPPMLCRKRLVQCRWPPRVPGHRPCLPSSAPTAAQPVVAHWAARRQPREHAGHGIVCKRVLERGPLLCRSSNIILWGLSVTAQLAARVCSLCLCIRAEGVPSRSEAVCSSVGVGVCACEKQLLMLVGIGELLCLVAGQHPGPPEASRLCLPLVAWVSPSPMAVCCTGQRRQRGQFPVSAFPRGPVLRCCLPQYGHRLPPGSPAIALGGLLHSGHLS